MRRSYSEQIADWLGDLPDEQLPGNGHRHDGGCTWAGCGPWDEPELPARTVPWWYAGALRSQRILAAQREPEYGEPDTLRELREES